MTMTMTASLQPLMMACMAALALAAHHPHAAAITSMPGFLMARDVSDILDVCTATSSHPCRDVGRSSCCSNDRYCLIDEDGQLACCGIGNGCRNQNSRCGNNSESYQCVITTTRSNTEGLVTTCCPRSCTGTSQYLCPSSLGGQCCGYDEACRSGGACEPLSTPPPTTSPTSSVPTTTATDADSGSDSGSSGGLSDAATAGVAAGSVVGGGLLIACAIWLFIRRRRRLRQEDQPTQRSAISMPSRPGEELMSDITAPTSRPGRSRTGTQDYFGPDPVTGPFTETEFSSPAGSPGISRAVPTQPQTPGDIAAPIEIDSFSPVDRGRDRSPSGASVYATPVSDTIDGRVELHSPDMYSGEFRPTPRSDPWQQR